ncbi:MAG: hypothetical protein A3G00_02800 [Candidatus Magasanikbacteria bacterium RIFCSPLOWO2_12_FULL_43_12]|uniref:Uncharacterized protein n=1 Tax=Candidatus Magasanikbacteria bacterium RIFCSPLOWO2_12_FULL_43_12 TaxID=1798692 RepID=A0A1F6MRE6_9BACT|nr:MAG: hypothetical protein A3I93_00375 [Candidatus Magasanikbacteria bacterium RIFCSPLOWO2_02_FULL_43_22]OGH72023.1 MAG: hypothetical protein A3C74_01120 [Candidatus Magasanikbacteria bacterium RIFCSPHIGHO2_02_FULL_44_13]OGH74221.1 MAG: hypothetical protein A3G00_02800 [Candidatus Magasanikbacteria bacterium RIFCSPLOWO2_12_FULL_43_12]
MPPERRKFAAKEKLVTVIGGIPPSENFKKVAGKSSPSSRTLCVHYGAGFPLRFPPIGRAGKARPREFRSDIFKQTPPSFTFSEIERGCLSAQGGSVVFPRNFKGIFEITRQRAVGNAEFRTNLFEKIPSAYGGFLLCVFFGLVNI